MGFAPWQAATKCTGSASPGARALMKHILDTVPGSRNLGIYNCRQVRGGGSTSVHSEGRALDVGMPMTGGRGSKAGHALVQALIPVASQLGIQAIIYDRKIWSAKSPKGRAYTGVNPHYDHLHIELTRTAAAKLTLATAKAALGGKAPAKPTPAPKPPAKPTGTDLGSRTVKDGSRGEDVEFIQRFLGVKPEDGVFGPKTEEAVRRYQRMRQTLEVDGVVGPATWAHMLKKKTP